MANQWIADSFISISADEIDVSDSPSVEDLKYRLEDAHPEVSPQAVTIFARYWVHWLYEMAPDDLVVVPLPDRRFAAALIAGPSSRVDYLDPKLRHRRPVRWLLEDGDRTRLPENVRRIANLPATLTPIKSFDLGEILAAGDSERWPRPTGRELGLLTGSAEASTPMLRAARGGLPRGPRRGERTPQGWYGRPLLEALIDLGGGAQSDVVQEHVFQAVRDQLTEIDLELLKSGEYRWRKDVQWMRMKLADRGLISRAVRGYWEITEAGRRALNSGEL